jgi:hypothetical protein
LANKQLGAPASNCGIVPAVTQLMTQLVSASVVTAAAAGRRPTTEIPRVPAMEETMVAKKQKAEQVQQIEDRSDIKRFSSGIELIPGVKQEQLSTLIIGDAPLLAHKFAEKQRKQILDKHKGEASAGRERKDPEANFNAARYRLRDGSDGVPAGGVKAAIVDGFGGKTSGVPSTKGRGAIRVLADDPATNLCRIIGPPNPPQHPEPNAWPEMNEAVVRNDSGVVDIRHRPQYWPWAMHLKVTYLPQIASRKQVLQAIAMAGFVQGLCEWRPGSKESKSGQLGTWRLANETEVAAFERGELFAEYASTVVDLKQRRGGRSRKQFREAAE